MDREVLKVVRAHVEDWLVLLLDRCILMLMRIVEPLLPRTLSSPPWE